MVVNVSLFSRRLGFDFVENRFQESGGDPFGFIRGDRLGIQFLEHLFLALGCADDDFVLEFLNHY